MEISNSKLEAWEVDRLFEIVEDYTEATREQIEAEGQGSSRQAGMARHLIFVVLFLMGYTPKKISQVVRVNQSLKEFGDQTRSAIGLYNGSIDFRGTADGILRKFTTATGRKRMHEQITQSMLSEAIHADREDALEELRAQKEAINKERRRRANVRNQVYRAKNREKGRAYAKAYREANKELVKARQRACYQKNKEKYNSYKRTLRAKNEEEYRAYAKAYRQKNKEKIKERKRAYREANKEKVNAYNREYYQANKERILEGRRIQYHEGKAQGQNA